MFLAHGGKKMKRNPNDKYCIIPDTVDWIEDETTKERLLFIIDEENRIVFRSLLEEDINYIRNYLKKDHKSTILLLKKL